MAAFKFQLFSILLREQIEIKQQLDLAKSASSVIITSTIIMIISIIVIVVVVVSISCDYSSDGRKLLFMGTKH